METASTPSVWLYRRTQRIITRSGNTETNQKCHLACSESWAIAQGCNQEGKHWLMKLWDPSLACPKVWRSSLGSISSVTTHSAILQRWPLELWMPGGPVTTYSPCILPNTYSSSQTETGNVPGQFSLMAKTLWRGMCPRTGRGIPTSEQEAAGSWPKLMSQLKKSL